MSEAEIVRLVIEGVRALLSLASQLGHGDAVRVALDAELGAARALTDAALAAKHAKTSARIVARLSATQYRLSDEIPAGAGHVTIKSPLGVVRGTFLVAAVSGNVLDLRHTRGAGALMAIADGDTIEAA